MINDIMNFIYKDHDVRTINKNGNPWFVAKDVCNVLALKNSRKALSTLDDDEKASVTISDTGQTH